MNRTELIEEMRGHTPPGIYHDATYSTTAMLRAWVAYCRSADTEKGTTEQGAIEVPDDYVGLFFGLQRRTQMIGTLFGFPVILERKPKV